MSGEHGDANVAAEGGPEAEIASAREPGEVSRQEAQTDSGIGTEASPLSTPPHGDSEGRAGSHADTSAAPPPPPLTAAQVVALAKQVVLQHGVAGPLAELALASVLASRRESPQDPDECAPTLAA